MAVALNYEVKYININKLSRPGYKLLRVGAIVIHYTANHGGTADNHFSYFNNLKDRYASAHIFIDRSKALEIIPLDEVAFHSNERKAGPLISSLKATAPYYQGGNANLISIGIEMCMEKDGTIHSDTIARTILIVKKMQKQFGVLPIYRHYDVTGKRCPAPFVTEGKLWTKFLEDVKKEDSALKFSSPTLQKETETSLLSKAHRQIIVDAAVKAGSHTLWADKLANGTLTDADVLGLAVKYTVAVNK